MFRNDDIKPYINDINQLIILLKAEGENGTANELQTIMDCTFSGLEMITDVNRVLKRAQTDGVSIFTKNKLEKLIVKIDDFLS